MSHSPSNHHDDLCGGVIGAGFFSRIQMDAWPRVTGASMVAVCDSDLDKARKFASDFGIPHAYASADAMLNDVDLDFVDIVTGPDAHLTLTQLAAERRVHVLCQKPMAADMQQAQAMVDCCVEHNVRLMINDNWRWQPWHRKLAALLAHGTIGQPFFARIICRKPDGRGEQPYSSQPYFRTMPRLLLYEFVCHFVDTSRLLFGQVEAVQSTHRRLNPVIAGEDATLTILQMQNNVTVLIDANRHSEPVDTPVQTRGAIHVEGTGGQMTLNIAGRITVKPLGAPSYEVAYDTSQIGYLGDSCRAAQQHFVDCLRSGEPFETSGSDYLKTFAAVLAGYESAASDRVVTLSAEPDA